MQNPVAEISEVSKIYREGQQSLIAVDGVSCTVGSGVFTMIVGPSGSGKTTLLNLIGCIDRPDQGSITVAGTVVNNLDDNALSDFRSEQIGFVFQNFNLFPTLSAAENIEYPLQLQGVDGPERRVRVAEMLDAIGLANFGHHRPGELSGGQKQRVAIGRALVKRPALILADEPTANLDSANGAAIVRLMRAMQAQFATSFVFSTHDPQLMAHADASFVMEDGKLIAREAGQ